MAKAQSVRERTFSVDPQQRPGLFPIPEGIAFSQPLCCASMMSIACNAVIYGRIWRRKPLHRALSQLVPCKGNLAIPTNWA
jgi:hypothetical protein